MKRIGILTYHRATNYGAVLQGYSLSQKLAKDFPNHSVEIIDYSTKRAKIDHIIDVIRPLCKFHFAESFKVLQKNLMFESFSNNFLKLSTKKIISDEIDEVNDYINKNYDIVISGSDAVFSWNGKVFPTAYLLGESGDYIKMSYAASAHRLFYKAETKDKIAYCAKAFESFSYLGIRDTETENFVKYCYPNAVVHHNCDPTFLLDIASLKKKVNIEALKKKLNIPDGKDLIIVMSGDAHLGKEIVDNFQSKYHIVSLFVNNSSINNYLSNLNPFEWATVFGMAKLTVTDYFHATILSLLNTTPVVSLDRQGDSLGYEGKIRDLLLNRLELKEYYLNIEKINSEGYSIISQMAKEALNCNNAEKIKSAIEKERDNYILFKERLNEMLAE